MEEPLKNHHEILRIWEKTVDVQMHFNDLCLRLRNVAISILGVLLGASALTYRFGGTIDIFNIETHISCIFLTIAVFVWMAFYLMDRFWYHELLRGAVIHAEKLETQYKESLPGIDLGATIRKQSHNSLNSSAATKLNWFYGLIGTMLVIGLLLMLSNNVALPAEIPG